MKSMNQNNLRNIRTRFRDQTGVDLKSHSRPRVLGILAAVLAVCLMLCALAGPEGLRVLAQEVQKVFHIGQDDPKIAVSASYEGDGIVLLTIENYTDQEMVFDSPRFRLLLASTGIPVEPISEAALTADSQTIPAQGMGTFVLDLNGVYDVEALEQPLADDHYYFVFEEFPMPQSASLGSPLFIVRFAPSTSNKKEASPLGVYPELLERMEPELREYAQNITAERYWWQENNAADQFRDQCRALIDAQPGTYVPPQIPEGWKLSTENLGVLFNDQLSEDDQSQQVTFRHSSYDPRLNLPYTSSLEEQIWVLYTGIPEREANKGTVLANHELPLAYFAVFDSAQAAQPEAFTLLFGQLLTFGELEMYRVYDDGAYVCYQVTDLFYQDLDAYVGDFLNQQSLVWYDEEVACQIRETYLYFTDSAHFVEFLVTE